MWAFLRSCQPLRPILYNIARVRVCKLHARFKVNIISYHIEKPCRLTPQSITPKSKEQSNETQPKEKRNNARQEGKESHRAADVQRQERQNGQPPPIARTQNTPNGRKQPQKEPPRLFAVSITASNRNNRADTPPTLQAERPESARKPL